MSDLSERQEILARAVRDQENLWLTEAFVDLPFPKIKTMKDFSEEMKKLCKTPLRSREQRVVDNL